MNFISAAFALFLLHKSTDAIFPWSNNLAVICENSFTTVAKFA